LQVSGAALVSGWERGELAEVTVTRACLDNGGGSTRTAVHTASSPASRPSFPANRTSQSYVGPRLCIVTKLSDVEIDTSRNNKQISLY